MIDYFEEIAADLEAEEKIKTTIIIKCKHCNTKLDIDGVYYENGYILCKNCNNPVEEP